MNPRFVAVALLLATVVVIAGVSATGVSDVDGDGLGVIEELRHDTGILEADTDSDGLPDGVEIERSGTDPLDSDTDADGLADGAEVTIHGSDPLEPDSDSDGLQDGAEVREFDTDVTDADSDDDGLSDGAEVKVHGTNPLAADTDGDSLADARELDAETDPTVADTDADGVIDGREVHEHETDPLDGDTDDDGLPDGAELDRGTTPTDPDTDGDGLTDGTEVTEYDTDPTAADTDEDGLADSAELDIGTDPTEADTDGDGLLDGAEVNRDALANADPLHMDVFVEIDWMDGEKPAEAKLEEVVEVYGDAPVDNPDGSTGIELQLVYSNELPKEWDTGSSELLEIMDEHMDYEDRGYHYAVAVENTNRTDVGGFTLSAEDNTPFAFKTDARQGYYYPRGAVQHLFMHEMGHALGISSTAFEGIDSETVAYSNYTSVMNYNAPTEALQYNAGAPFDDWEYIVANLQTPRVATPE